MTIQRRLIIFFFAILLLFAANIAVYFYNSRLLSQATQELNRALENQLIVLTLHQDIDNIHKEAGLFTQILPTKRMAPSPEVRQLVDENLHAGQREIAQLASRAPHNLDLDSLASSYGAMSNYWLAYFHDLLSKPTSAVSELSRAELLARQLLEVDVPRLQQSERQQAQAAQSKFQSVGRFTSTLALFFFLTSTVVAALVAWNLSRHLTVGLQELKQGAALLGSGRLDHKIQVRYQDEFGELATALNEMAMNLRTARSQIEQANLQLRRSEEQYRSLFENAIYGIFRSDDQGCFLDVNSALVSMLGYPDPNELIQVDLVSEVFDNPVDYHRIAHRLNTDAKVESERADWRRKDQSLITVRLSGRVIHKTSHELPGFEMIVEDITEKCILEDRLRQAHKMEAVGRLAGGVAHDFNNLLTIIQGHSELLKERSDPDESVRDSIQQIREAADRAASLTSQLLAFGRRQMLQTKVLDVNALVVQMGQMLRRLIGEHIEFRVLTQATRPSVKADEGQIQQVILNLAVNARDAMAQGGALILETANVEVDEARLRRLDDNVPPGQYVMLSVSDTGVGMDAQTQAHIFEPFFTTKELGKGTGLGLAMVYGIVKQSGGWIWVYSEPGKGTTFKVYLPLARGMGEAKRSIEIAAPVPRGTETVLIAEDEEGIRELACHSLERAGYNVLAARDGNEAVQVAEGHYGPVHILVTDVVMPKMSGRDLAQKLISLHPGIKVVYMSGYSDYVALQAGLLEDYSVFLNKPFSMDNLVRRIREALDSGVD